MPSALKTALNLVAALAAPAAAFSGDLTYYSPGLGACGLTHTDSDAIVAVSPSRDGNCGRTININYNGRVASATVADKCMGCVGDSIDVSPAVFQQLEDTGAGRISVDWEWA
ncbi:RlpA-like double-psi beta-barrel-protein domain-containing protein-containing protein [Durotheca rogersii]|uniref:RlpA-like double-psi beta-barrel-protein domain-containing protein-containing protein n=1 Tax=Durotheca rogersii TaxID=419775 RepID=UPI00221F1E64|nr:RlpA-like double-psi beta-barrel-protein domain-containing protein-containing protein [Durotheca rogersii]KAI5862017.1 RlpA-like double-psi beta-barrel-protein domain-containing protein-containing protein [Durotheca rogersii]